MKCFYGSAFPQCLARSQGVRGLSPKARYWYEHRNAQFVSFECDSLSEELEKKKKNKKARKKKSLRFKW